MECDVEEEEDRDAVRVSSPAGIVSHPLFEEATLALLPDRSATCCNVTALVLGCFFALWWNEDLWS